MYVGRIAAIGKNKSGQLVAMYRVSTRSFPNRQAKPAGKAIAIVPEEGFESDIYKNPYIAYNCLRVAEEYAVVGNGMHVDPIAEKLETGMPMRDAFVSVLSGMDYEHDHLNTPRIAGAVNIKNRKCLLGIIRCDALIVQEMSIENGEALYIATYEHNFPGQEFRDGNFDASSAEEACDYILGKGVFSELENPVSAACAMETRQGFLTGYKNKIRPPYQD